MGGGDNHALAEVETGYRTKDWLIIPRKFGGGQLTASTLDAFKWFPNGYSDPDSNFSTAPFVNVIDAKFCHHLGWYYPRFSIEQLSNFTGWSELLEGECD